MVESPHPASENGPLIVLIEDDPQIRRFLRATLPGDNYRLMEATTAQDGLRLVGLQHPDLIILDLGLPDVDGIEVARRLREWTLTPILVLSAREEENDKIAALDAGADDYLTKPFGTGELLARIRAALRRTTQSILHDDEPAFTLRGLRVDFVHRQVFVDDKEIHLSPIEYKLLTVLIRYAGRVVTRDKLLKEVWGPTYTQEIQYLRVYMGHLRQKLETDPTHPQYLLTEAGVGYRLKED